MKTIIFDLGGVVVARNPAKVTDEFKEFFSFLADKQMPHFWEEYDRGTQSMEQTIEIISQLKGYSIEHCRRCVTDAINMQEPIAATEQLMLELYERGYQLLVLSNMSREFIDFIRLMPLYRCFSGEVVSCEEGVVKPEEGIYKLIIERFNLDVEQTLFVDDRPANIEAAANFGIQTHLFKRWEAEESCDEIRAML